ncbi:hypothetical protein H8K33_12945 [Undibacterium amnicola]|uniref:Fibronectin type-III domain-containing protein n=1 Tax=Undibacterium amnicola TaxID=1834038 RepID=A0ABR6XSB9_9BURK|nr:hypothetical protein [Undibacterium amnicola]MBC3832406.1 hypothetical protein [Undibacterium amnicola]
MKNILFCTGIAICALTSSAAYAQTVSANKASTVSYARDLRGNTQVKLENQGGKTKVTNTATGEFIIADGELAGKLTDHQYTHMMLIKNEQKIKMLKGESDAAILGLDRVNSTSLPSRALIAATNCTFSYSITGGGGGWSSPLCYLPSTSNASISISATSSSSKTYTATLYRDISFWPDKSYGTKNFSTSGSSTTNSSASWTNIDAGSYYYVTLSTTYDGRSVWGQFTLSQ